MTEHDQQLIEQARKSRWEDIDEDAAETKEGRDELRRIIMRKYHKDELRSFGVC